jgi:hypothetical protein
MLRVEVSRDILYPTLSLTTLASWSSRVSDWLLTIGPGFTPHFPPVVTRLENAVVYLDAPPQVTAATFPGLIRQWSDHGYGVTVQRIDLVDTIAPLANDAAALDQHATDDNPLTSWFAKLEKSLGVGAAVLVGVATLVGLVWFTARPGGRR